ncbi:MAG: glycosyltransferase family 4 protein [Candidatus Promineofilum sp.]|nr:glycosyltransferase family 4 protein [Promineifilum sp.]
MRILHIVHQYVPDHVAGTELYTQSVARRQAQRGHEVAIFTPLNRPGRFSGAPDEEDGVRVYRVPVGQRSATAVFRSTFGHAGLSAALETVRQREAPDIVHLQHLMGLPAGAVLRLEESGSPYVISLHDYWYGCANGQLLTNDSHTLCAGPDARFHNCGRCAVARAGLAAGAGLLGPLAAPLMRRRDEVLRPIFDGARRIMAPNEFVRQVHAGMGFSTARVVINPLGLDRPPGLAEQIAGHRTARIPGELKLGYVGSISRQKGLHVLIEAMNELPVEGVTLDIYGDLVVFPAYVAELRALVRHPGIRFNGLLPRERLWAVLGDMDALVMPTLWYEASPATIREAFAAGLPVIASDLGAPGSMIRHGVDGLLFPAGDVAALQATLARLAADPARLDALRAGIPQVRTEAEHVRQIDDVYRQALTPLVPSSH